MRRPLLLAAVAIALAGCGSDADDSPSAGTTPEVTFATAPDSAPATSATPAGTDAPAGTTVADTTASPPNTVELAAGQVAFEPFVTDVPSPVDLAWRQGDSTLFVVLQGGAIVPVRDGVVGAPVFKIGDDFTTGGEQGLLGLAFHPAYATNRYFYVNYTRASDGATVIERYRTSSGNANVAPANSAKTLLVVAQPASNHNGGNLAFGADGYLYVGMGDGGGSGDPSCNAQKDSTPVSYTHLTLPTNREV